MVGQIADSRGLLNKFVDERIAAYSIPLFRRVIERDYEVPPEYGNGKIKGIVIKDFYDGSAEPSITLGGIGFNFVQIKLKSERGSGFDFGIEIYV